MTSIAKEECNSLGTIIINDAIKEYIADSLDYSKLFIITYNDNKEIESIDLDTVVVNRILTNINIKVQDSIKLIELGKIDKIESNVLTKYSKYNTDGLTYKIPLSIDYSNPFISNISPKVPVKINMLGSVNSTINNNIKNYGINNVLLETYLDIEVKLQVVFPFQKNETMINSHIPIGVKIIKGKIPDYYSNNGSNFSIPVR